MKSFRIVWGSVPVKKLGFDEVNKFLDKYKLERVRQNKTNAYIQKFEDIREKYFVVKDNGEFVIICGYCEKIGFFRIATQPNVEEVRECGVEPTDAMEFVNNEFKKIYKKSMEAAFKVRSNKQAYCDIKKCVPSPINWAVDDWRKDRNLYEVQKADVSSAYPAELVKRVPTLDKHLRCKGRVEPTAEYPFAFYLKSQHIKIIEEDGTIISTFDLAKSKYYMATTTKSSGGSYVKKFYDIKPEEDETILCAAAPYSFEPIMTDLYENRKQHPEYKQYMNYVIGLFHANKNPRFSQIAAIVLLRCSWNMEQRLAELEKRGCSPLLVNTDSIAWLGDDVSITTDKKTLGAFVLEHRNCEMIICSPKKYQWKDGEEVNTTWAGVKDIKSLGLAFGDILNPRIIAQNVPMGYRWDDEKSRYILGGVII